MLGFLLGALAVAFFAGVVVLTVAAIRDFMKEAEKKLGVKILESEIRRIRKSGNYNEVNIGLMTEYEIEVEATIKAEEIDNDIHEGMRIPNV